MRRPRPYPPCRRRSSRVMTSASIVSPAGMPSRITTSARPCDSPAVRKRTILGQLYTKFLHAPGRPAVTIARKPDVIRRGDRLALGDRSMAALLADRFIESNGRWIDLATGDCVRLRLTPPGTLSRQVMWADQCAALARLRHPVLNALVD